MDNLDIRNVLPMLRQFGISPERLDPNNLEKLIKLTEIIKDPSDITPEISRQIIDIMGISTRGIQIPTKHKKIKIGRNEPCPCMKGNKYKHCCGKNN